MNDRDFDDPREAADWIKVVEGPSSKGRARHLQPLFNTVQAGVPQGEIIDIGCGQGACRSMLDLKHWTYYGIDPSTHLIARARQLNPDSANIFSLGNAYSIPFANSRFDAAITINVWHLLSNPELAAKEMLRILKPNGRFLVVTAHPNSIVEWAKIFQTSQTKGNRLIGENIRNDGSKVVDELYFYSENELKNTLISAGASEVKIQEFRFNDSGMPMYLAIYGQKLRFELDF